MRTLTVALLVLLAQYCVAQDLHKYRFEGEVACLAQLAASADAPEDRRRARGELEKLLGDNRDLAPDIITLLTADEDRVQRKAAEAIVARGAKSLPLMPIIVLVEDERWTIKEFHTYTGKMREQLKPLALPPPALVELLEHDDVKTRQWALETLSDFGPAAKGTLPKLIDMLSRPRQDPRILRAVLRVIRSIGPEATPALPAVMKLFYEGRSYDATGPALKAIGEPSVEPLTKLLADPSPRIREHAINTLSALGEEAKRSLPELRERLRDEHGTVRIAAANAVWRVGDESEQAALVLAEALSDKSLVLSAAYSLCYFGPEAAPATDAIVRALKADVADLDAQRQLVLTLAKVGPAAQQAAPLLKEIALDGRVELRDSAALAVWKVTGDQRTAIASLTTVLEMDLPKEQSKYQTAAAQRLGEMGPAAAPAIPILAKHFKQDPISKPGSYSWYTAGRALIQIGPAALPVLREAAQSEDERLRRRAESTINQIERRSGESDS